MIDPDLSSLLDAVRRDQSDRVAKLVAADKAAELGLLSCEWLLRYTAMLSFTRPILSTGSRVYGSPRLDSDWDWVVLAIGTTTRKQFIDHCDPRPKIVNPEFIYPDGTVESRSEGNYRFGPINIIHVGDHVQWEIWKKGTTFLLAEAGLHGPRTRDRAIEVFAEQTKRAYAEYAGIPDVVIADEV